MIRYKNNTILEIKGGIVYFTVLYKKQEFVASVNREDWKTISKYSWSLSFNKKENKFRTLKANLGNKYSSLHRFLMKPKSPDIFVDHVNGNILDNTRKNLRLTDAKGNAKNITSKRKNNKSGVKGVNFHKPTGKWAAQIQSNGKKMWLGVYDTKEAAIVAYQTAAEKHFGEFVRGAF